VPDIVWLRPDGSIMEPEDWDAGFGKAIGVFLNGEGIRERDRRGERIIDRHFVVLFNAHDEAVEFTLPMHEFSPEWEVLIDTAGKHADSVPIEPGGALVLEQRSLVVLCAHDPTPEEVDHSVAASLSAMVASTKEESPAPKSEAGK
jgi:isoamylase